MAMARSRACETAAAAMTAAHEPSRCPVPPRLAFPRRARAVDCRMPLVLIHNLTFPLVGRVFAQLGRILERGQVQKRRLQVQ